MGSIDASLVDSESQGMKSLLLDSEDRNPFSL
jgi:hypothetical protein